MSESESERAMQRSPFRAHWLLDPQVRFLNHGSFGACPRPVLEAQAALRERMEREPVLLLARELQGLLDGVRAELAPFLGAAPEELGFVRNATTGVNAVLGSLALRPGDELLVSDQGYNACRNAAEHYAARAGAHVVTAKVPFPLRSPDEVIGAVLERVGPRTRLALLDHVTSPTGIVLPIERLVRELRERGVETLVDGAHAPGMVELDLARLGAAYYTGNCHKWLCAPKGAAFLHVRRDLRDSVRPAIISHGSNSLRPDRSRFELEFDWVGTDDPTPILALPAALRFLGGLFPGGWPELRRRNRALALAARALLLDALDARAPAPEEMIGALATVPLPDGPTDKPRSAFDVDPLQLALFERHALEVPIVAWPAPPRRWVRVSAQVYNDLSEYRALADALRELLAQERSLRRSTPDT